MKNFIKLFFILTLFAGCSSDDDNSSNQPEQIIDGGEIFTSQLIVINIDNVNQDEYDAKLGELNIKALKSADNEIIFFVPINFELGETIFEIENLNLRVKYTVNNPVLSQSVEQTIAPLNSNIQILKTEVENEHDSFAKQNVLASINLFVHEWENATNDDKKQLAEFYFVNKELIDDMFQTDYTNPLDRNYNNLGDDDVFHNFKVSVVKALAISGLSYLAFNIPSPDLFSKLLAAGTAIVAVKCWFDAWDLFFECKSRRIFTKDFLIGNISSSLSGNNNQDIIIYSHNILKEDLVLKRSGSINNSYIGSTITTVSEFFENLNVLQNIINKVNYVINKVNQFNPFSEIENIPNAELDDSSTLIDENAFDDILNNISYSISDNNINIESIQFQNGIMNTTLSIVDQDIVSGDYVETNLNFQYQDEFNDIQGSYPIRVMKDDLNNNILNLLRSKEWSFTSPLYVEYICYHLTGEESSSGSVYANLSYFSFSFNDDFTVSTNITSAISEQGTYNITNNTLSFTTTTNDQNGSVISFSFSGNYEESSNNFNGTGTYNLISYYENGNIACNEMGSPTNTYLD